MRLYANGMRGATQGVLASAGPANTQGPAMQEPWGATTAGNAMVGETRTWKERVVGAF